jgi:hypothetical protein
MRLEENTYDRVVEMPIKMCIIEACIRGFYARSLCKAHYRKLLKWGNPLGGTPLRARNTVTICSVKECFKKVHAHNLCSQHWCRLKKHGDPMYERKPYNARAAYYRRIYGISLEDYERLLKEQNGGCEIRGLYAAYFA